VKTPVTIAPEALDFTRLIRSGETVGWAEATAEPVFLTRLLDTQADRCPPFRVFFALTFSDAFNLAALPLRRPQPGDPNPRDVLYP
jgi:hypothetical protein